MYTNTSLMDANILAFTKGGDKATPFNIQLYIKPEKRILQK